MTVPTPPAVSDALEALTSRYEAEIARLTGEREAETAVLTAECKVYRGLAEKYAAAAEAAEAETARLRAFVQHCEREVYPLVRDSWALNDRQANAFINALNEARAALSNQEQTDG